MQNEGLLIFNPFYLDPNGPSQGHNKGLVVPSLTIANFVSLYFVYFIIIIIIIYS
jgi:hypothetical protein